MATYSISAHQRLDGFAVVQSLVDTDINVGQTIVIANCPHGFNGTHVVLACPQYAYVGVADNGEWIFDYNVPRPNQYLFASNGGDQEFMQDVVGTITWTQTCTWITTQNLTTYLDIPLTSSNAATLITQSVAAANAFAYRRRVEAGYLQDSLTTSPSADVTLGTLMIAAAYFRQQGSYTALASFDGMGVPPANGITPMVLQLLGINRPQVA